VTHDLTAWKDEIAWMSLYFSAAVWASLALCVFYSMEQHLPRHRAEPAVASWSSGRGGHSKQAAAGDNAQPALAHRQADTAQSTHISLAAIGSRGLYSLRPNSQPALA
jgi:hypothetical protein